MPKPTTTSDQDGLTNVRVVHPQVMDQISVVLVRPMGDGNVGQVARAMKNFGMRHLVLVNPQYEETDLLKQMAVGAHDVIRAATVADDLETALGPFQFAVGTSRRVGKFRPRFCTSRGVADWLLPQLGPDRRAALIFGNEQHGLSMPELDLCNQLVEIVTDPGHRSLNLAQAVLVLAYELFSAATEAPVTPTKHVPATYDQMQRMYNQMRALFLEVGFIDRHNPDRNIRQLRRLFARAAPTTQETRILRGMMSDTEWYLDHVAKTGVRDGYREVAGDGEPGD